MNRLPALKAADVIRKLRAVGFIFDRHAKGSHEIWYCPTSHRRTVIPHHSGKDIAKGTLRAIVEQAGLTLEEFLNL